MCFNPCFNGTMYKNYFKFIPCSDFFSSFNPCFNGTMYKNKNYLLNYLPVFLVSILVLMELCIKTRPKSSDSRRLHLVSILVLMELCIKTFHTHQFLLFQLHCFNPCFNGTMYKNIVAYNITSFFFRVSILVLMELCIKTLLSGILLLHYQLVSILVLMELCIKTH